MIDMGTVFTWIPADNCTNCMYSNTFPSSYTCPNSEGTCRVDFEKLDQLFYPKGFVWGSPATDYFIISGVPFESPINHTFYLAHNISKAFYNISADGLFGLGLLKDRTDETSFLHSLKASGLIDRLAFSLFLSNNIYASDTNSKIIFGGFDTRYMKNPSDYFKFAEVQE